MIYLRIIWAQFFVFHTFQVYIISSLYPSPSLVVATSSEAKVFALREFEGFVAGSILGGLSPWFMQILNDGISLLASCSFGGWNNQVTLYVSFSPIWVELRIQTIYCFYPSSIFESLTPRMYSSFLVLMLKPPSGAKTKLTSKVTSFFSFKLATRAGTVIFLDNKLKERQSL